MSDLFRNTWTLARIRWRDGKTNPTRIIHYRNISSASSTTVQSIGRRSTAVVRYSANGRQTGEDYNGCSNNECWFIQHRLACRATSCQILVSQTEHHSLHQRTRGMSDEIYRTPW